MLAEWATIPLLLLFVGGLLMPGWRSLAAWVVVCVCGLMALLFSLGRGTDSPLGDGLYAIAYLLLMAALIAGALVKAVVLLLRRRPKQ